MSCAPRERRRTKRPKATSGSTITGIAPSTKPDSRGLVTTIIVAAPTNSTRLRSAIDTDAPTADLIWVVSAVSREIISPVCALVEERRRQRGQMREHLAAQIGDDPLAERRDEIEAQRAGDREHGDHARSSRRNSCRSAPRLGGEAEIDHAPHGERHRQRRQRRDDQRDQRQRAPGRDSAPHTAAAGRSGRSLPCGRPRQRAGRPLLMPPRRPLSHARQQRS